MKSKLIEIKKARKIIFVGDTHGNLEAGQKVIRDYLKPGNKIVFLGDYVDRGSYSKENLDFLLETKRKYPDQIYLLQGNHEGHHILKFSPAEFWEGLDEKNYQKYFSIVEKFPFAVHLNFYPGPVRNSDISKFFPRMFKDREKESKISNGAGGEKVKLGASGIIALHGALPDIKDLKEINKIKIGDENWFRICWGDFIEEPGEYLGIDPFTGRPQFGKDYFFKLMERFGKKVLIRSHQPDAPLFMFDDRCLTIFTSSAYEREKTIAIYDFKKPIKDARDLEIKIL